MTDSPDRDLDRRSGHHPDTVAIEAGRADQGGALAPVVWASTAYTTSSAEEASRLASSVDPGRFYSRHGNPGVRAFEETVAALEGAEAARAFSSGMGAVTAVVLGICATGDHIVTQRHQYRMHHQRTGGHCAGGVIDMVVGRLVGLEDDPAVRTFILEQTD